MQQDKEQQEESSDDSEDDGGVVGKELPSYSSQGEDWGGLCGKADLPQSPIDLVVPPNSGGDSRMLDLCYLPVNAWEEGLHVRHTGSAIVVSLCVLVLNVLRYCARTRCAI